MMTVDPQGQKASLNGAKFEDLMEHQVCEILGIEARKYTDEDAPPDVLLKNVPYKSIYETNCRSEFLLRYKGRKIRIECKYQEAKGSVDEKLPYLMMNFTQKVPEEETIIITHGDGFRDGAINWLRESCIGTKCQVFSPIEFVMYLMRMQRHADCKQE